MVSKKHSIEVVCKFCGDSESVVRYGTYRDVQRYYCQRCKHKFVDRDTLPGMRTPIDQVSSAVSMTYEGIPFKTIRRHLQQTYGNQPSDSTIYSWVVRFTKLAISSASSFKIDGGDIWIADDRLFVIAGIRFWVWDVMDDSSRLLLASCLTIHRTLKEAQEVILEAIGHTRRTPKVVVTDKTRAYVNCIETLFGADTQHILCKDFGKVSKTRIMDRLHLAIRDRNRILDRAQNVGSAKLILDGWLVHHNFFRPVEALDRQTPAEMAGIEFQFRSWADIVRGQGNPKQP